MNILIREGIPLEAHLWLSVSKYQTSRIGSSNLDVHRYKVRSFVMPPTNGLEQKVEVIAKVRKAAFFCPYSVFDDSDTRLNPQYLRMPR